jgi:hypothetical protein
MQLRRPGQSERWRVAVFVAVVGLHFVVGLLLFAVGTVQIVRPRVDTPLSLLTLAQESPPPIPIASPASNLKGREASRDIELPVGVAEPEPKNAITLPFDSRTDADAAARRNSDKEESERRRRNLAGPSESQLMWWKNNAPLSRDHKFGDTEHAEGGELIAWMDDKCYYTTHGISTSGMPQTSQVCKDPPKPETELFKDMRKKLDEAAKGSAP